jgi:hypothetical protein
MHGRARFGKRAFRLDQFRLFETVHCEYRYLQTVEAVSHCVLSFNSSTGLRAFDAAASVIGYSLTMRQQGMCLPLARARWFGCAARWAGVAARWV